VLASEQVTQLASTAEQLLQTVPFKKNPDAQLAAVNISEQSTQLALIKVQA